MDALSSSTLTASQSARSMAPFCALRHAAGCEAMAYPAAVGQQVGLINDPDTSEPYVQKFSAGIQKAIGTTWSLSSDYVQTLGLREPRVLVVNPRIEGICNPAYPGANPGSPDCVRGVSSRLLDRAFVESGFPIQGNAARMEQINMIGTKNRSLYTAGRRTAAPCP